MRTIFFVLFFIFTFWQSPCQVSPQSGIQVVTGSNNSIFDNVNFSYFSLESKADNIKYENIDGSPYIVNSSDATNNLPIGEFYTASNKYLETALGRYNAYTDDMEISLLNDGLDYYYLKKKANFFYIILGKTTYRAYQFKNDISFFVIISKNDKEKCTLLKQEKIVFKKEKKAASSFVNGTPDSFKRLKDVYYFKIESSIKEIPKKKKHLQSLFVEKNSEMKEFIHATKLKLTKEEDLLRISEYYNSLFE